jgi:hypothetical protein
MGNFIYREESIILERIIDTESLIIIGLVSEKQPNPYSAQAIRIGWDGKVKRLESFEETDNYLKFEYESNTTMTLTKRNKDIIIHIKDPKNKINIVKTMSAISREVFTPIKLGKLSFEYDKIDNFIGKPNFEDVKTEISKLKTEISKLIINN